MSGPPRLTNWAGNLEYQATRLHEPETIEQAQEIVRRARRLRVLGSRHSFSDIADTTGEHLSLARVPRTVELDAVAGTVTVDGGARYGDLCPHLEAAGFALHNLASLPHISIAGACATATHGSGDRLGNLATNVRALELITADGEIARFDQATDVDMLHAAVVSLGGLGVVTRLTLATEPTYRMRQDVYEDLPLSELADRFDEIASSADSVSFFTEWRGPTVDQVWLKRRVADDEAWDAPKTLFGATLASVARHPIRRMSPDACTAQLGIAGPWHERLPHFRMDHTPSAGDELQSEYVMPREHAVPAVLAVDRLRDRIGPLIQVSEVRTIASDGLWLSTASGRASVALHFTWKPDWAAVRLVLPVLEEALSPFEPRPHWGKLFTMPPDAVRASYPKLPRFAELLGRYDPSGKFRNSFLDRYILGS